MVMQTQARICPVCIDDHSEDRECKVSDLVERIESLRTQLAASEQARREAEEELQEFRCLAHGAHNPDCVGCVEEQLEIAEAERDEARYVAVEMYELWFAYCHADKGKQSDDVMEEWGLMVKRWLALEDAAARDGEGGE